MDLLQRGGDGLAILVGHESEAVAQQVNDAGRDHRFRKHRDDRLGEALQTVDDGEQHVLDAAISQLVHDPEPELGALVLLEPEAKDFLRAVGADPEGDMRRLVSDRALIADFHPHGVEEDQGIDRLERAGLPGRQLFQHRVGHGC